MKKIVCALLLLAAPAFGMDLAALGMLETGNNDAQIGSHHEVSRYQCLPKIWHTYAHKGESRLNPVDAASVVNRYWAVLDDEFVAVYHRHPNAFEAYRMWNSPTAMLEGLPVTPAVADRAERYVNLVEMYNDKRTGERSASHSADRF